MTASRSGWTPLFLNAEPSSTGVTLMSSVAARSARRSMSGVTDSSSTRNVSISSSSWSATASISWWWYSCACSSSSVGISPVSIFVPRSSAQVTARISTRSTIPRKCSSWPTGSWIGTGRAPRRSTIDCTAPDGLGLRLHARDGVEDGDRAVEHAQAALHLDRKVHVPGRIDDVDAKIAPGRRRGSRRDRDAALLLLRHPVHNCSALVHLAHLVGAPGVVEDALGRRGLARVDVGHDPDVADALESDLRLGSGHRAHHL